jgi:hypothetical protein
MSVISAARTHAMQHLKRSALAAARLVAALALAPLGAPAAERPAAATQVTVQGDTLSNGLVKVLINRAAGTYSIADARTGEVLLAEAGFGAGVAKSRSVNLLSQEDISDELGKGRRLILAISDFGLFRHSAQPASGGAPSQKLISFTLHENHPALILGFGLKTPAYQSLRVLNASPLEGGRFMPGKKLEKPMTLNGGAGADETLVKAGDTRECANSMLLTGLVDGKRRCAVFGGLANGEFGKFVGVQNGAISATAEDPVGRLVPTATTYLAPDTIYVDVLTADPFAALERYGLAMRAVTHANPNVYDFPVLCGWSVGAISKLPDVNNSAKLIEQLEAGNKAGIGKYTRIGVRLEPDKYLGNSEQGWWDDAHWAQFKHLVPPYPTVASWCQAVRERNGIPYIYFQAGMPSDDFAEAHPDWMLFNSITELGKKHPHHQPFVTYDYTDTNFSAYVVSTWKRLRAEGMEGVKFDYPETAWRPEGGFDDRFATTTSAYRRAFALVREGFGPDRLIDERNLGESGRPMLDVTAGIVDTQRSWTDSNGYVPAMVSIDGLRWYKNRVVFNYFPDTKTVHNLTPLVRKSMLTMMFLTSGRFDMATSYSLFTPEMARDFTRVFPHYREPKTARPVDAFTGVKDPQVYDLALTPDWHQVALFNSSTKEAASVSTALAGEVADNALGLDAGAQYHAYEFWTDTYLGRLSGQDRLDRRLEPLACAMISVRKVEPNPQVLSTDRHLLQGWVDLAGVRWDASSKKLLGTAKVVADDPFKIVVANNGAKSPKLTAAGAKASIAPHPADSSLTIITLESPETKDITWSLAYD